MNEILRNTNFHDTETLLLLLCLILLALAKALDEQRFQTLMGAFLNQRYLKIYGKEPNSIQNPFNTLLFFAQIILFSLLLYFTATLYEWDTQMPLWSVLIFVGLFVLFKYYLEKMIAVIFGVADFLESFQFYKLTYRNLIAVILIPFIGFFLYSQFSKSVLLVIMLCIFILLNITALALSIRHHQNFIQRYFFYFILYLCALEIAPYLILFKAVFR